MEHTLLNSYDIKFRTIPAAGLHGVGFWSLPRNISLLFIGWRKAKSIIHQFKPHVMFLTGGYLGVPVAIAGKRIPSVVFIPDIEPGLALKTIIRFGQRIAAVSEASLPYLGKKQVTISGYPVRKDLIKWDRKSGRDYFKIPRDIPILMVYGGSKGARSINLALRPILSALLEEMHVIHISGPDNWEEIRGWSEIFQSKAATHYHAYPFLNKEIGAAFAAADLVVCRAGASTMGELPFFGLPAILVPYPFAWKFQQQNAAALEKQGGAVILNDSELQSKLQGTIQSLIKDKQRLQYMSKSMKRMSKPDAAEKIAEIIIQIGNTALQKEASNG